MSLLNVLVADSDDYFRNELRCMLERNGHHVQTAAAGSEAIRLLKTQAFDLLVTEVLLPDGDGLDVISFTKRAQLPVRIVAISGGGRYLSRSECLKLAKPLGAHAVALKPMTSDQLLAAIKTALSPVSIDVPVSTMS